MTFLATEEEQIAYLDVLAGQVAAYGWTAHVRTPPGRLPHLFVQDPENPNASGDIVAVPDSATGEWWFWFSYAQRIAPVETLASATQTIIKTLHAGEEQM